MVKARTVYLKSRHHAQQTRAALRPIGAGDIPRQLMRSDIHSPLKGEVEERDCPVCHSAESRFVAERIDTGKWVECQSCTALYLNPAPTAAALDAFYSDENYWGGYRAPQRPTLQRVKRAVAKGNLNVVDQFSLQTVGRTPRSAADVGAGWGGRLARLREVGVPLVAGCEPDAAAADWARTELDINMVAGEADNMDVPEGGFELVICSEVIEHVSDPVKLLEQCKRLMAEDGWLIITTPNAAVHHRAGSDWKELSADFDHIALFNDASMRECMKRAGLRTVEVLTWGLPVASGEVVGEEQSKKGIAKLPAVEKATRAVDKANRVVQAVKNEKRPPLEPSRGYRLLVSARLA